MDPESGDNLNFTGRNLGPRAMRTFFRLIYLGPPWIAFSHMVTVILQPGEILNLDSKAYWDRDAPEGETRQDRVRRVVGTLRRIYATKFGMCCPDSCVLPPQDLTFVGFSLLVDWSDVGSGQGLITVLGRTVDPSEGFPGDRVISVTGFAQTAEVGQA